MEPMQVEKGSKSMEPTSKESHRCCCTPAGIADEEGELPVQCRATLGSPAPPRGGSRPRRWHVVTAARIRLVMCARLAAPPRRWAALALLMRGGGRVWLPRKVHARAAPPSQGRPPGGLQLRNGGVRAYRLGPGSGAEQGEPGAPPLVVLLRASGAEWNSSRR